MKNILKFQAKPINKFKFGSVREDQQNGMGDCSEVLGELLSKIHKKYSPKQKFKVSVFFIPFNRETQESGYREEVQKTVSLATLLRWYKEDAGESFDKNKFIQNKNTQKSAQYEDSILASKRTTDSGFSKSIR